MTGLPDAPSRPDAASLHPPAAARVVGTVAATLVAGSLPMFLIAAMAPRLVSDLDLNASVPGLVVAAFFLAAAAGSIPGGWLVDRIGARVGMRAGLLCTAVGTAAAAGLARGPISLIVTIGATGIGIAALDPAGARSLSAALPSERHGRAFGIKEAAIPAASMLAGLSLPVLGAELGWRPAFVAASVLAVLVALAVPARIDGQRAGGTDIAAVPPVADAAAPESPATDLAGGAASGADPTTDLADGAACVDGVPSEADLRGGNVASQLVAPSVRRRLIGLSVAAALAGGAAAGLNAYLVTAGVDLGLTAGSAGTLLAGASLLAVATRLVLGALADGGVAGRATTLFLFALGGGAGGLLLLALGAWLVAPLLFALGALLGLGAGWGWTGLVFLAAVRLDPLRPAAASGVVLAGLAIGGVIGPALVGIAFAQVGSAPTFSVAAVAMAAAAGVAWISGRARPAAD
ncbi:MAG: MFS transporter [Nitriliruptoraceae bacterium]|nr:MFS transporter [Nitriliruptoraceae bacterium]